MFRKPRPRPPKARPASDTLTDNQREDLADTAVYIGSPHHTDVPKNGIQPAPRENAKQFAAVEGLKNPDCLLCPRKWAHRSRDATALLRAAICNGTFVSSGPDTLPAVVWARDVDEPTLVYEAKRLSTPSNGYKAYPLSMFQVDNLPVRVP